MTRKVVLAGGSGFIGQSLAPLLVSAGYEVAILTRTPHPEMRGVTSLEWDGKNLGNWASAVDGAAAVVNLAGRSINCRHTPDNRRLIVESRVDSVHVLGQAIAKAAKPPGVFVQAAAVGIYGDAGDRMCDEKAAMGEDFVARTCQLWEAAFHEVIVEETRGVLLRLGVVLGRGGGILAVLGRLTRLFLGGHVGNGRQFISWIHLTDVTRIILWAIETQTVSGTFNTASPNPATNAEFMRQMRGTLHRPWSPPVPALAGRIGSWLMGTEASLALASQRAIPRRLLEQGFQFNFPELRPALENLLRD